MGRAKSAIRKAQVEKMLWDFSRGRGCFWLGDQGNSGSFKKKKTREQADRVLEKGTASKSSSLSKGVEVGQAWSVCEKW